MSWWPHLNEPRLAHAHLSMHLTVPRNANLNPSEPRSGKSTSKWSQVWWCQIRVNPSQWNQTPLIPRYCPFLQKHSRVNPGTNFSMKFRWKSIEEPRLSWRMLCSDLHLMQLQNKEVWQDNNYSHINVKNPLGFILGYHVQLWSVTDLWLQNLCPFIVLVSMFYNSSGRIGRYIFQNLGNQIKWDVWPLQQISTISCSFFACRLAL